MTFGDLGSDIYNRLKPLQAIYDHNLIVVWYDNTLPHYELEGERKLPQNLSVGETKTMNCGKAATFY